MKKDIIAITVLFFVIIGLSIWFSATPSYVPYSSTIFSNQAKFEAFSNLGYSSAENNSAMDGSILNYSIEPPAPGPKAVSGFEGAGVFNTPEVATAEKLDIFSQASGSLSAEGYGYYNSRGSLVLDDKMKNLLQSRGGNTSGCGSTVGGSTV